MVTRACTRACTRDEGEMGGGAREGNKSRDDGYPTPSVGGR